MSENITKRHLFNIWMNSSKKSIDEVTSFILKKYNICEPDAEAMSDLQKSVSCFITRLKAKWEQSNRHLDRFVSSNENWLNLEFVLPNSILSFAQSSSTTRSKARRPKTPFDQCSSPVKKRKVEHLLETKSKQEILLAAELSLRSSRKRDAAQLVRELSQGSPQLATHIKKLRTVCNRTNANATLNGEQALALMVNAKLSTNQYKMIRKQWKSLGNNGYPSYEIIKREKQKCYPIESSIKVTEDSAEVKVQNLMDHTIQRICSLKEEFLKKMSSDLSTFSFFLIAKWGCDGSSNQSRYKQKFTNPESNDENLFAISMVPLQLYYLDSDKNKTIIWFNPNPSSVKYCRPIKLLYKKESVDLIKFEIDQIKSQIDELRPVRVMFESIEILVTCQLLFTMVDGKICTSLSQYTSSQVCYICGAKPSEMNQDIINKPVNNEMLNFGISPLHSWIRCFECLLHIAYRLEIKKWQVRSAVEKEKVASRKKEIQIKFRTEMGLLVDVVKQGHGTTNDGNTARRFFKNTDTSAAITGIDKTIIHRFRVILETISTTSEIDSTKFVAYTEETRKLYLKLYPWYYMPSTVHKILVHGKDILDNCILPLGQLSEEAQESRHKDYRHYREIFTRKNSRICTHRDILNRCLFSSDPKISSNNAFSFKSSKEHNKSPDVSRLLKNEDQNPSSASSDSHDSSDEGDI